MGERHCSKIAIMQLFHELKQQFPALPDHVVSQCIVQNSHDRESCARSLRATQESRPPPGAFPPPAPQPEPLPGSVSSSRDEARPGSVSSTSSSSSRPHRPSSLDIDASRRESVPQPRLPTSAPPACASAGFFNELQLNIARSPQSPQEVGNARQRTADSSPMLAAPSEPTTRSFTSVSLTLRPPTAEPQPPIDISSHGSSLTYSSSSLDPRGFQSRLQISIGHGGQVIAGRIKPPPVPQRPNSLAALMYNPTGSSRPPGLPTGPPSQLARPTATMSAPTTPSDPAHSVATTPPSSLPTTPLVAPPANMGVIPRVPQTNPGTDRPSDLPLDYRAILDQVEDEFKPLVMEQLIRKNRLAKALDEEKIKLEAVRKEVESLTESQKSNVPPKDIERQLRSEIYQLQLECDRLTEEVDKKSDRRVPLGETNEEFYQSIYTGQEYTPQMSNVVPPPLPSQPPAWETESSRANNQEEMDGPSWVCKWCTFDNHPLMHECEQCNIPRHAEGTQGDTQDIHIRVTHHHNLPHRRTVHNRVV